MQQDTVLQHQYKVRRKEDIAEAIMQTLVAIFGAPKVILSDIGGEVSWSNGTVERHNVVIVKMVDRLKLDNDNAYPIDVIVSGDLNVKNVTKLLWL